MPDDGEKPPHFVGSMTVLEFAELQGAVTVGLRISGLQGAELNRAVAAACDAVIAYRASASPQLTTPRSHLRIINQDDPPGAA